MATEPLTASSADATVAVPNAAQLAARIQIPRRLPPRYDGQPLQHLSHSSYNRFILCPEDWRRRYILGEKTAPTGSMFLGRQVDDAISLYYQHILDHRERLSLDQVKDAFWDGWKAATEAEREQFGISWEADLREETAFKVGLDAIDLTFSQLIPELGEPVAVQRKVEFTLSHGLEWSVLCYLDLETRRSDAGELLPAVVDYKVKTTPLTQYKADHDFQPAVYLAGRWLEGDPAAQFCFAQIAKPGPRRKEIGASIVTTRRSTGQLRGGARPHRAGRSTDRRLLRAVRARGALGIRRPQRMEVQRALLRGVACLPGRLRALSRSGHRRTDPPETRGGRRRSGPARTLTWWTPGAWVWIV